MDHLTIFCAIPHRPGIDNINHAEWGIDYGERKEVHEQYGEGRAAKDFTDKIRELLPLDYEQRFVRPEGQGSAAISLGLCTEDFSEEHWEKVLVLIRKQWPKTSLALGI